MLMRTLGPEKKMNCEITNVSEDAGPDGGGL